VYPTLFEFNVFNLFEHVFIFDLLLSVSQTLHMRFIFKVFIIYLFILKQ